MQKRSPSDHSPCLLTIYTKTTSTDFLCIVSEVVEIKFYAHITLSVTKIPTNAKKWLCSINPSNDTLSTFNKLSNLLINLNIQNLALKTNAWMSQFSLNDLVHLVSC